MYWKVTCEHVRFITRITYVNILIIKVFLSRKNDTRLPFANSILIKFCRKKSFSKSRRTQHRVSFWGSFVSCYFCLYNSRLESFRITWSGSYLRFTALKSRQHFFSKVHIPFRIIWRELRESLTEIIGIIQLSELPKTQRAPRYHRISKGLPYV